MNGIDLSLTESLAPLVLQGLLAGALTEFLRFVLVVVRLSGLFIIGPLFGQQSTPMNIRVLLILSLALIITPALPRHAARGFDRLDANGNGWLAEDEVPVGLVPRFHEIRQATHRTASLGLTREDYTAAGPPALPTNLIALLLVACGELAIGLVLSLGTFIVLNGLQLAGQMIDQQAGFSLGQIFNPEFDSSGSTSGQMLFFAGLALFLVLEPFGGHLVLLRSLIQSYETLPCGAAFVSLSAIELLGGLVQQSLILGIRVAAPLVVMMSLVDLTLGFLGHSVPQVNIQAVGYTTRAGVCLLILAASLSSLGDVVAGVLGSTLESLRDCVVFPAESW